MKKKNLLLFSLGFLLLAVLPLYPAGPAKVPCDFYPNGCAEKADVLHQGINAHNPPPLNLVPITHLGIYYFSDNNNDTITGTQTCNKSSGTYHYVLESTGDIDFTYPGSHIAAFYDETLPDTMRFSSPAKWHTFHGNYRYKTSIAAPKGAKAQGEITAAGRRAVIYNSLQLLNINYHFLAWKNPAGGSSATQNYTPDPYGYSANYPFFWAGSPTLSPFIPVFPTPLHQFFHLSSMGWKIPVCIPINHPTMRCNGYVEVAYERSEMDIVVPDWDEFGVIMNTIPVNPIVLSQNFPGPYVMALLGHVIDSLIISGATAFYAQLANTLGSVMTYILGVYSAPASYASDFLQHLYNSICTGPFFNFVQDRAYEFSTDFNELITGIISLVMSVPEIAVIITAFATALGALVAIGQFVGAILSFFLLAPITPGVDPSWSMSIPKYYTESSQRLVPETAQGPTVKLTAPYTNQSFVSASGAQINIAATAFDGSRGSGISRQYTYVNVDPVNGTLIDDKRGGKVVFYMKSQSGGWEQAFDVDCTGSGISDTTGNFAGKISIADLYNPALYPGFPGAGCYEVYVIAFDQAGNSTKTDPITIRIDQPLDLCYTTEPCYPGEHTLSDEVRKVANAFPCEAAQNTLGFFGITEGGNINFFGTGNTPKLNLLAKNNSGNPSTSNNIQYNFRIDNYDSESVNMSDLTIKMWFYQPNPGDTYCPDGNVSNANLNDPSGGGYGAAQAKPIQILTNSPDPVCMPSAGIGGANRTVIIGFQNGSLHPADPVTGMPSYAWGINMNLNSCTSGGGSYPLFDPTADDYSSITGGLPYDNISKVALYYKGKLVSEWSDKNTPDINTGREPCIPPNPVGKISIKNFETVWTEDLPLNDIDSICVDTTPKTNRSMVVGDDATILYNDGGDITDWKRMSDVLNSDLVFKLQDYVDTFTQCIINLDMNISSDPPSVDFNTVQYYSDNEVYVAGNYGIILRGSRAVLSGPWSWSILSPPSECLWNHQNIVHINDIKKLSNGTSSSGTILAVGQMSTATEIKGVILISYDNGAHWGDITTLSEKVTGKTREVSYF